MTRKEMKEIVRKVLNDFDEAIDLSKEEIELLIYEFTQYVRKQPICNKIKSGSALIVGDIHGDFKIIKKVVRLFLNEGEKVQHLIFLGDIVDRGSNSIACLNLLFALKTRYPERVHVIRGNHESLPINTRYGFKAEIQQSFNEEELYDQFNRAFGEMSLALVHEEQKIFFVHGGIPINGTTIDELNSLPKGDLWLENHTIMQMLWNDPKEKLGTHGPSIRGMNIYCFGSEIVDSFLEQNNLKMIVRAHEAFPDGFRFFFNGRVLSLFSSEEHYSHVSAKVAYIDEMGEIDIFHPMEKEKI
ncbi:MAG: hypothetical protein GF308_04365 [Candidatus Heimdallarchaeota archaeon]|nr:hypothetical protein [Candidatus Heimdallarchaeota archaeon]